MPLKHFSWYYSHWIILLILAIFHAIIYWILFRFSLKILLLPHCYATIWWIHADWQTLRHYYYFDRPYMISLPLNINDTLFINDITHYWYYYYDINYLLRHTHYYFINNIIISLIILIFRHYHITWIPHIAISILLFLLIIFSLTQYRIIRH